MKLLPLAPYHLGLFTKLDDDDYDRAIQLQWNWHAHPVTKATRRYAIISGSKNSTPFTIYMHRWLMSPPEGYHVDHINGDGLDNQRANLRIATPAENCHNRHGTPNTESGYWGVSRHTCKSRWICQIRDNYKTIYLGLFISKTEAAFAYDQKVQELRGPISHLNFPEMRGCSRGVLLTFTPDGNALVEPLGIKDPSERQAFIDLFTS